MEHDNIYEINHYTRGEKARWLRKHRAKDNSKKGYMSSEVLAKKMNISSSTLNKIENDEEVNLSSIIAVSDYFDVSIDWLCSLSNIRAIDDKLNFVCKYTGLSEEAINEIRFYTKLYNQHSATHLGILNKLIVTDQLFKLITSMSDYCHALPLATSAIYTEIDRLNKQSAELKDTEILDVFSISHHDKDIKMHLYDTQEIAKGFIRKYAEKELSAYTDAKQQLDEIIKRINERNIRTIAIEKIRRKAGDTDGNNQETQ